MSVTVVNGGQYGDEGKGKIVDYLGGYYDIGIRSTAGDNAGHTLCVGDMTLKMRLIPSTILDATFSIIADDVLINPITLHQEIETLERAGIDVGARLLISPNAHLVFPFHKRLDELYEEGQSPIGTTKRGIGPAMADKVNRVGIRMEEFVNVEKLAARLEENLNLANRAMASLYGDNVETIGFDDLYQQMTAIAAKLRPMVVDTVAFTHQALDDHRSILVEGAQGSMLDLAYGSYPYVTASRPLSSGLIAGAAIGPTYVDQVLSVIKPYQTRVGRGAVMAEISGDIADHICRCGREFGTVTGRARRVMWLDTMLVDHARRLNGTTAFALAKLDVMDQMPEIKICTGYRKNGQPTRSMPSQLDIDAYEPVFETLPGWQTPIGEVRRYQDLPTAAKRLIERIQELTATPIAILSVGSDREHTIDITPIDQLRPGKTFPAETLRSA